MYLVKEQLTCKCNDQPESINHQAKCSKCGSKINYYAYFRKQWFEIILLPILNGLVGTIPLVVILFISPFSEYAVYALLILPLSVVWAYMNNRGYSIKDKVKEVDGNIVYTSFKMVDVSSVDEANLGKINVMSNGFYIKYNKYLRGEIDSKNISFNGLHIRYDKRMAILNSLQFLLWGLELLKKTMLNFMEIDSNNSVMKVGFRNRYHALSFQAIAVNKGAKKTPIAGLNAGIITAKGMKDRMSDLSSSLRSDESTGFVEIFTHPLREGNIFVRLISLATLTATLYWLSGMLYILTEPDITPSYKFQSGPIVTISILFLPIFYLQMEIYQRNRSNFKPKSKIDMKNTRRKIAFFLVLLIVAFESSQPHFYLVSNEI